MTTHTRVLNVLNSNHRRGAEAFAMDLAGALIELGADVHTSALTGRSDDTAHDVQILGHGRGAAARATAQLLRRSRDVDVILGHGGRTLLTGALVRQLGRRPFAYRVIGEPMAWVGGDRSLRHATVGLALRRADAIVGYVRSQTDVLVQEFGVDPDRIRVIPKGIELSAFTPISNDERREARISLGLDGSGLSDPVVAYVGALTAQKNVEQVIRSVSRVAGARLVVAGDGPHEPVLRELAESVPTEVTFTGSLSNPRTVYSAADVLALTSRTEGVPTVLLEAALMGLPVVATRVGGIPETVVDGTTGLLVDVDDDLATATAISDSIRRKAELGAAARAHGLAAWDIGAVAGQWLQLLDQLRNASSAL